MDAFNCLPFGNQAPRTVNPNANFGYNVINTNIPPPSFMRQTGQIQTNSNFQSILPPHAPATVQATHTPPCFRASSNFLQSPPPPIGPVINQVRMPNPQWNNNSYQNSQENIGSNLRFNTPPPRFVENRTPNSWSNNSNGVTNRTPNNWSNESAFNNSNDITNRTPNNWSNNSSFINSNDVTNRSPVSFAGSNLFTNNFMNQRSLNQYNKVESQFSPQNNPQSIIGNQASKIHEHRSVAPFKQYGAASNITFQGNNTPVLKTNVPDSNIFNNPNAFFNMVSANNLSPSAPIKFDFRNRNFSGTPTHSRESIGDNSPFKRYFEHNHNDSSFQNHQNKLIGNKGPKLFNSEFNKNKNENLIELVTLSDNEDTIKKELTDINGSFTETTVSINGEINNTNVSSNNFLHSQNFSNKNNTFNQTGQNKAPWMSESIQLALDRRNALFKEAKSTNKQATWDEYKALKQQIDEDIKQAKNNCKGGFRKQNRRNEYEAQKILPFYCDTCDRAFATETELQAHCNDHVECEYVGCKFKAHFKIVALHKRMQHETGYAEEINKLENAEEINKWRAERKKRFPTAENILKRKAEQAEKEARGEVVENRDFGKFNKRQKCGGQERDRRFNRRDRNSRNHGRNRWHSYNRQPESSSITISDSEAEEDAHINIPRFKGINHDYSISDVTTITNKETNRAQSEEIASSNSLPIDNCNEVLENEENASSPTQENIESDNEGPLEMPISKGIVDYSEDEGPLEVPISKVPLDNNPEDVMSSQHSSSMADAKDQANEIKKETSPHSLNGNKKQESDAEDLKNKDKSQKRKRPEDASLGPRRPYIPPRRRNSLLEMLLDGDIRHERNMIMQCIRHIVKNKFFMND